MTTPTLTRRIPVDLAHTAGNTYRRFVTALTNYRRDTGRVLAVHCPACRTWVKPKRYAATAGTCRRCAGNRDHAAYQTAREQIRHRRSNTREGTQTR